MKYLVTGAAGFLGSQIVAALARRKSHKVVAHDIIPIETKFENVDVVSGDILDGESLLRLTESIDVVFHNAALVPVTKAGKRFFDVNIVGTENVIRACRNNGVTQLIHLSSSAIYGLPIEAPITPSTPCNPIDDYGKSKLEAERRVIDYIEAGGRAISIRPRTIVGGSSRLGIFQILFQWISEGRSVYIIGDGSNLFQFLHVRDLISAIMKASQKKYSGVLNVGSQEYGTIKQTLEKLCRYASTGSIVRSLPVTLTRIGLAVADRLRISPLAPYHYMTYHMPYYFDISYTKAFLDWSPTYSDYEGLTESYDWYIKNRNRIGLSGSANSGPVSEGILKFLKFFS